MVVGGAGRSLSPLAGAIVVGLLPELLAGLADYHLAVFGAGLLVVLWIAPGGLVGAFGRALPRRRGPPSITDEDVAPALDHVRGSDRGLVATGVRVSFGGVVAVAGVDLVAPAGRVTSVIGPNGAGKTTLLNLLSGFQRPDGGTVRVGASDITGRSAQGAAAAGLARTFQTTQLFGDLTVLDNVRLGLLRGRWRGNGSPALARSLLAIAGYGGDAGVPAATLAHVDRRLVEIARALATRPAVLLLDEPAAGLDAADTARLEGVLRGLARAGLAVVLVEHDMELVMSVSDAITVLDAGRRIAAGTPAAVRADSAVRAAYLGAAAPASRARSRGADLYPDLLDVRDLSASYGTLSVLDHVHLRVGRGETIAVLGPNGAGKSTMMKALSGLIRPVRGTIRLAGAANLAGRRLDKLPAYRVARAGLILVPEGRQVFPHLSVAENLRLGATRRSDFDASEIEAMLTAFPALRPRLHAAAGLLSGGEQQMLAVARGLLAHPEILLLDEPSLGLAPAIAADLFGRLARLRDDGLTLVIADQMAAHALAIADRGLVLGHGRVEVDGAAADLRAASLEDAYLGASPLEVEP